MTVDLMDERRCRATSKRSGKQCRRFPVPGARVCSMHGGASPGVRAAAERRRAEAEATALLETVWRPDAAPVTDPVRALQRLLGQLQHAGDVLGARLETAGLDGPTALAWSRVLRELRLGLEGVQRLGLDERRLELEQAQADHVVSAAAAGLDAAGLSPAQRDAFLSAFMAALGGPSDLSEPSPVVRGELE